MWQLIDAGLVPGGTHRNLSSMDQYVKWHPSITDQQKLLLCDAQTSGGLLISVSPEKADLLIGEMSQVGLTETRIVGKVLAEDPQPVEVGPLPPPTGLTISNTSPSFKMIS